MDETEEFFDQFAKDLGRTVVDECAEAIRRGQSDKAMILLPGIEDPPTVAPLLLHSAAKNGLVDLIVQLVCTYKFDVERVDADGWRPIHWATYGGHVEVLQLLITAFNCSPNSEAVENVATPLMLASVFGHLDAVVFLTTASQCDVNARRLDDGSTALHLACIHSRFDVVQHLVTACNADVNAVANDGATPLHVCDSAEIAQCLVGLGGASVSVKTREGLTPLHSAC